MNPADILNIVTSQYGNVVEKYTTGIMLAGLIFALLNCFMGYKLRKVWGSILGLVIGAAAGGIAGYYFLHEATYVVIAGLAGAVVLGALAWVFYKLGIFVLCAGLVYALANSFFSAPTDTGRIICIAIGIFAATMAIGYEEYVIIGITGICGGLGAIRILFSMTGKDGGAGTWLLGLILAFLGIAVQRLFFETGKKSRAAKAAAGNRFSTGRNGSSAFPRCRAGKRRPGRKRYIRPQRRAEIIRPRAGHLPEQEEAGAAAAARRRAARHRAGRQRSRERRQERSPIWQSCGNRTITADRSRIMPHTGVWERELTWMI